MIHSDLEALREVEGREVLRRLRQAHLDERGVIALFPSQQGGEASREVGATQQLIAVERPCSGKRGPFMEW